MTPAWTDEDLACLARDYRNHPDVYDLIEGVRRVLALHNCRADAWGADVCDHCVVGRDSDPADYPCDTVRALNDPPNGATP